MIIGGIDPAELQVPTAVVPFDASWLADWKDEGGLSRLRDATSACEDAQMSPRARAVDPARLVQWCMEHLGSPPADEIFRSGYLSAVIGLRLADDREVVVKVRPDSPRIAACVEVQRRMFQAGYPCPQPLTGAVSFGEDVATAEAYVPAAPCSRARTTRPGPSLKRSRG